MIGIVPAVPLSVTSSSRAGGSKVSSRFSTGELTIESAAGLEPARMDAVATGAGDVGRAAQPGRAKQLRARRHVSRFRDGFMLSQCQQDRACSDAYSTFASGVHRTCVSLF